MKENNVWVEWDSSMGEFFELKGCSATWTLRWDSPLPVSSPPPVVADSVVPDTLRELVEG